MRNLRRRLCVDSDVQFDLVKRFVFHWLLFVAVSCLTLSLWTALIRADLTSPLSKHLADLGLNSVILTVSFISLCPFFVFDTLRLTNRFAGPIVRLRRVIQAAGRGERIDTVRFRRGDYWEEIADDLNKLIAYYENALAEARAAAKIETREECSSPAESAEEPLEVGAR